MFPRTDPPYEGVRDDGGNVVAYVIPVGEYERMRYEMEELQIGQIVAEYRRTGKLPRATPEEEAAIVAELKQAVPFDLKGLIRELEAENGQNGR
jgi:hypothetical protein